MDPIDEEVSRSMKEAEALAAGLSLLSTRIGPPPKDKVAEPNVGDLKSALELWRARHMTCSAADYDLFQLILAGADRNALLRMCAKLVLIDSNGKRITRAKEEE